MSIEAEASHQLPTESPVGKMEPVAIVGISCRYSGSAETPDKYWNLLLAGRSAVGKIPEERWASYACPVPKITSSLAAATQYASFLSDIDGFDADFFGISAREAECIDPQQRIVLELSWEALENAGILPSALRGTCTGVYMAANSFDFGQRLMGNLAEIQPWTVIGSMLFGIANRVSYALDLRGPSMVVDTACAGSLTALHLACQALRQDEMSLAIVGGVNIMSNPGMTIALDALGATAPDGRCKAFDKAADGYGRGEGAGVVVLKLLSAAQKAGDRILAVVKGTGVFQDGRTAGMMAPNGDAQEFMLRRTYERFGVSPSSVQYIEAHGTGTQAGDKAEVGALAKVFGTGREEGRPCLLGSAKPNVGHLEAGAGMAGLIKTVLSMRHGVVPPSIHAELNPQIDWAGSGLKVAERATPWPSSSQSPRRAGVSSFGIGGAIAHAIVEEPLAEALRISRQDQNSARIDSLRIIPLSARSKGGLRSGAARLADWLQAHSSVEVASVGNTLGCHRDHLQKRMAVTGRNRDELISALRNVASDVPDASAVVGQCQPGSERGVVWVFSGHGAQWSGMATELLREESIFATVFEKLAPIFKQELGYTPREAVHDNNWSVERVQATTFAMQLGLAALWRSRGLEPAAVIGHSMGEMAASVVAGALDMMAAARFACRRARIYGRLAGRGGMLIAGLSFEEAQERLAGTARVVAATAASPVSTVVSGDIEALNDLAASWKRKRIPMLRVAADAAFHSPQIDALLPDIRLAAADLVTHDPTTRLYTTSLSNPRCPDERGVDFWAANSRNPVMLVSAVKAALEDGFSLFLEVSSAPIVAPSIRETADHEKRDDVCICGTLSPNRPEAASVAASLATLFCNGANIDWSALYPPRELVDLPTMAWQHRSFWPEAKISMANGSFGHAPESHTLLGIPEHIQGSPALTVWRTRLEFDSRPYPGTHPICGVEIIPAAVLLLSLMKAGARNGALAALRDIALMTPIPVEAPREIQFILHDGALRIASQAADREHDEAAASSSWTVHTTALLEVGSGIDSAPEALELAALRSRCHEIWSREQVELLYRKIGIGGYGFPWRLLDVRRGESQILALFDVSADAGRSACSWAAVLDGAITISLLLWPDDETLRMPSRIGQLTVYGEPPAQFTAHVQEVGNSDSGESLLRVMVADAAGKVIAKVEGVVFAALDSRSAAAGSSHGKIEEGHDTNHETPSIVPVENRLDWLVGDVRRLVAGELKLQTDDVEVKRSLVDMGVDSLMAVSLRVGLRRRYGFEFPPTLLWNNPSVYAIAQFIEMQLSVDQLDGEAYPSAESRLAGRLSV
jgi:acyl transferase domain-containing protein/acyl carrier protein